MNHSTTSITEAFRQWRVWLWFARRDIKARYRGSFLGPLWLVLNLGILVGGLSLVYGTVFGQPLRTFIPYLTAGFTSWWFVSNSITDSCGAFTVSSSLIRNQPLPIGIYPLQVIARQSLLLVHNLMVFVVVAIIFGVAPTANMLLFLPAFVLVAALLSTIGVSIAIICTRYRDIPHLIANVLTIAMLVTPIMYLKNMLGARGALALWNPFFHMVDIMRSPLLGEAPLPVTWLVLIGANLISAAFALWLVRRAGHRVAYLV